jgi:hypothetical protein
VVLTDACNAVCPEMVVVSTARATMNPAPSQRPGQVYLTVPQRISLDVAAVGQCEKRRFLRRDIAPSTLFFFSARALLLVFSFFHIGCDGPLQRNRGCIDSCHSGERVSRLRILLTTLSGRRT